MPSTLNSAQENNKVELSSIEHADSSIHPGEEEDDVVSDRLNDDKKMDLKTMWTAFNKCKSFIKHGQRLENMSWRLWNYNHQQSFLKGETVENQFSASHTQTHTQTHTTKTTITIDTTINTTSDTILDTALNTSIENVTPPPPSNSCISLTRESPVKANSIHEVPQLQQQKQQKGHDKSTLLKSNESCNNELKNNRTPKSYSPILSQQQQHAHESVLRNAAIVKHGKRYIYIVDDDDEDDDYYPSDDEDDYYDYDSDGTNSCSRNDHDYVIEFKKTIPQTPTAAQRRSLLSDLFSRPPSLLLSNSTSSFGTTSTSTTTTDNSSLCEHHIAILEQRSRGLTAGIATTGSSAVNASASLYHPSSNGTTARKSSFPFAPFFNKTNNEIFNWKESFRGW